MGLIGRSPVLPTQVRRLSSEERNSGGNIDYSGCDDEAPVLASVGFDDTSTDRDTNETGDGDHGICGGVVTAIFLGLAELTNTDRGNCNACSAGKSEE